MKAKRVIVLILSFALLVSAVSLFGCGTGDKDGEADKTYTITYDLDGGTNAASNPTEYKSTSEELTLAAPTKEGYEFLGWLDSKDGTWVVTKIEKGSTGDKTFYAKWKIIDDDEPTDPEPTDPEPTDPEPTDPEPTVYTIKYVLSATIGDKTISITKVGEATTVPDGSIKEDEEFLGKLPRPTEISSNEYEFAAWMCEGEKITEVTTFNAEDFTITDNTITLNATFELKTITVAFDYKVEYGGSNVQLTVNGQTALANKTIKSGDKFSTVLPTLATGDENKIEAALGSDFTFDGWKCVNGDNSSVVTKDSVFTIEAYSTLIKDGTITIKINLKKVTWIGPY